MRRHLPIITIVFCQALLAVIATFLHRVTRPEFMDAYKDFDRPLPWHATLALSGWFLPSLAVVAIACDAVALLAGKRSVRHAMLSAGLVIPAIGLALAIDGIFVPLFQAAPGP